MKNLVFLSLFSGLIFVGCNNPSGGGTDGVTYGPGVFKQEMLVDSNFKLDDAPHCTNGKPNSQDVVDPRIKNGTGIETKTTETFLDGRKTIVTSGSQALIYNGKKMRLRQTSDAPSSTGGERLAGSAYYDMVTGSDGKKHKVSATQDKGGYSFNNSCDVVTVMETVVVPSPELPVTPPTPVVTPAASSSGTTSASTCSPGESCPQPSAMNVASQQQTPAPVVQAQPTPPAPVVTTTITRPANPAKVKYIKGQFIYSVSGKSVNALLTESRQTGEIICNGESKGKGELIYTNITTNDLPTPDSACSVNIFYQKLLKTSASGFSGEYTVEATPLF